MGEILYGPHQRAIEFDDRVLGHLEVAIFSKLRHQEAFTFSWRDPEQGAAHTIWLFPTIPFEFVYDGDAPSSVNRAWVEHLLTGANNGHMQIVPEPSEGRPARGKAGM